MDFPRSAGRGVRADTPGDTPGVSWRTRGVSVDTRVASAPVSWRSSTRMSVSKGRLSSLPGIRATFGARLDLPLAGQGGGPRFDRPHGHSQARRDLLLAGPLLPQGDEGGLVGGGHVVLSAWPLR
jgi:hypothetical protein